jgi:predicted SnoaL-like aldol condensation-catalyzing enzyme
MTSDESRAIVQRLLDAFNAREFDRAERLYAPDYVNHSPPPFAKPGGETQGTRGMRDLVEGIPDARAEVVRLVEKGNLIVLHSLVRGRHAAPLGDIDATDGDVALEFINIFRIEGGRICESWGLVDSLDLLRQLGVTLEPRAGALNPL